MPVELHPPIPYNKGMNKQTIGMFLVFLSACGGEPFGVMDDAGSNDTGTANGGVGGSGSLAGTGGELARGGGSVGGNSAGGVAGAGGTLPTGGTGNLGAQAGAAGGPAGAGGIPSGGSQAGGTGGSSPVAACSKDSDCSDPTQKCQDGYCLCDQSTCQDYCEDDGYTSLNFCNDFNVCLASEGGGSPTFVACWNHAPVHFCDDELPCENWAPMSGVLFNTQTCGEVGAVVPDRRVCGCDPVKCTARMQENYGSDAQGICVEDGFGSQCRLDV